MKTKVLKFVMPVFAFILAIGLAFATEVEDNSRLGYYFDQDTGQVESITVDCDETSDDICMFKEQPVYAEFERINLLKKSSH